MNTNENNTLMFAEYPDVVGIDDLQRMLRIGRSSAYDILQKGLIKTVRIGKRYIIPKQSVIAFLKLAN